MENETVKLIDINGLSQYHEYVEDRLDNQGTRISELIDNKESLFRYYDLPEASEELENQIVQYIGETDVYTKGYFYECVGTYDQTLGEIVYSWQWVDVAGIGTALSQSY